MSARGLDRGAVVETAEEFVDRDGSSSLTMTALAAELGVRGPSLYAHVESLEMLLGLVQTRALAELGSELQRAAMGRSGPDGIRSLALALRAFATRHPGRYELAMSEPIDRPAVQTAGRLAGEAFAAIVESVGAPLSNELAFVCLSTLHGAIALHQAGLFRGATLDIDAVYSEATELVVQVVERTGAPGPAAT